MRPLQLLAMAVLVAACHADTRPDVEELGPRIPGGFGTTIVGHERAAGTRVSCSTCHGGAAGGLAARNSASRIHSGIELSHGAIRCLSCHDRDARDFLHLADGTTRAFAQSMELCAQCHGPQMRDYQHGAHGGMRGYWDTERGGRLRNHCITCHDPHRPAVPQVRPARAPTVVGHSEEPS